MYSRIVQMDHSPRSPVTAEWILHDEKRFRGGLIFKADRWLYHSTLGSRVIKKKKRVDFTRRDLCAGSLGSALAHFVHHLHHCLHSPATHLISHNAFIG